MTEKGAGMTEKGAGVTEVASAGAAEVQGRAWVAGCSRLCCGRGYPQRWAGVQRYPPALGAAVAGIRVLVPFDRSAASRRGLGVALRLAGVDRRKSVIHPVYVVEVDRALELDAYVPNLAAEGEAALTEAEAEAKQAKVKCEGWLLQARDAGPGIVEEAVSAEVDLVVIGVGRATTIGDRGETQTAHARHAPGAVDLGRTADYVLSHAPCEVIVVREAADDGPAGQ